MKLWLITQSTNRGYDTYDSAVVAAEDEESARKTYPGGDTEESWPDKIESGSGWTLPVNVTATYIGEAEEGTEAKVICASYNAG
jgi:hypothetical protein